MNVIPRHLLYTDKPCHFPSLQNVSFKSGQSKDTFFIEDREYHGFCKLSQNNSYFEIYWYDENNVLREFEALKMRDGKMVEKYYIENINSNYVRIIFKKGYEESKSYHVNNTSILQDLICYVKLNKLELERYLEDEISLQEEKKPLWVY